MRERKGSCGCRQCSGKEHKQKKAKAQKSHRTIELDPATVEMLREWKAEQATQLAVATDKREAIAQTDETPVCTSRSGGFLEPDTVNVRGAASTSSTGSATTRTPKVRSASSAQTSTRFAARRARCSSPRA
ncbi:MAG: hypothetical protein ACI362_02815 [Coriobacteriales bacterium]